MVKMNSTIIKGMPGRRFDNGYAVSAVMRMEITVPTTVTPTETPKARMNVEEEMTSFIVSSWKPTGRMPTLPEVIAHSALTAFDNTLISGSSIMTPRRIRKK
ncbi:hypothetical protein D3C81_1738190 [compost metagenome]